MSESITENRSANLENKSETQENIISSGQKILMPEDLWSLLGDTLEDHSKNQANFFYHWLQLHSANNSAVEQGVIILKREDKNSYFPIAKWPIKAKADRLATIAEKALVKQRALLTAFDDGSGHVAAAYPIHVNEELYGVVGIELNSNEQNEINKIMSQLQWSVGWVERVLNRIQVKQASHHREQLESSMRLLAAVQSEPDFTRACMAFVTELATQLKCDRVSLGFPKGKRVVVQALSHSAQVAKRMNLIRAIALAMEEAIIFGKAIRHPPRSDDEMMFADHQALANQYSSGAILSLPVYANDKYYCVVSFERSTSVTERHTEEKIAATYDSYFTQEEIEYCRSIAALCAPSLEEKRLNHRSIWKKMASSLGEQLKHFIGRRYVAQKLTAAICIGIVVFFSLAKGEYRVSSDSILEGRIQRVIAAPFAGYIKDVGPKAGDIVTNQQELVSLDDKDLRLERLNYLSEIDQYQKEYQDAFAKQDRATLNIVKAQLEQAQAKLELAEAKLQRTKINAPFDGILIYGDLSQRVGGFVERGEELFILAPLDDYRLILHVNEHRIADLQEGPEGKLVLAAVPNQSFAFTIVTITPETAAQDGENTFRVEAHLLEQSPVLRPGMEGVAKVSIGERHLIAIWTKGLRDWVRLFIWRWLP